MPVACAALPRAGTPVGSLVYPASPPAPFVPVTAKAHVPPYNDVVQNNPCGVPALSTVGGVSVAAENLCLAHWAKVHGLSSVVGPITFQP